MKNTANEALLKIIFRRVFFCLQAGYIRVILLAGKQATVVDRVGPIRKKQTEKHEISGSFLTRHAPEKILHGKG